MALLFVFVLLVGPRSAGAVLKYEFRSELENDAFVDFTSDQNYTMGSKLSFYWPAPGRSYCDQDNYQPQTGVCVRRVGGKLRFSRLRFGVAIGQMMWTPDEIEDRNLRPEERPWAGLLYFGFIVDYETPLWHLVVELDLGFTGKNSFAREVQVWWHELVPAPTQPWGWDHQIGTEFIVNLHARVERRLFTEMTKLNYRYRTHHWFDASVYGYLSLGTLFAWGGMGGGFRLGYISNGFQAATLINTIYSRDKANTKSYRHAGHLVDYVEAYLFASFEIRAVWRDGTLQGALFAHNPHTVPIKRWVPRIKVGVRLGFKYVDLIYAAVIVGPEVDTFKQREDWHHYGQIFLRSQFW